MDGNKYNIKSDYSCHYEDFSWISSHGPVWHDRVSNDPVKVIGQLSDGGRYEVMPMVPWEGYGKSCQDKTESVTSRLFLELPGGRVESFDNVTNRPGIRRVTSIESKYIFHGTVGVPYEPSENWIINKNPANSTKVSYYAIVVAEYAKDNWKNRLNLQEFIKTKKIPWLESGGNFPFTGWSNDDVLFAREHYDALRVPILQRVLKPSMVDNEVWSLGTSSGTITWLPEPVPTEDEMRFGNGAISKTFKRWVDYRGVRIEVPLISYYRLIYDEQRDRIIKINVVHVDLW